MAAMNESKNMNRRRLLRRQILLVPPTPKPKAYNRQNNYSSVLEQQYVDRSTTRLRTEKKNLGLALCTTTVDKTKRSSPLSSLSNCRTADGARVTAAYSMFQFSNNYLGRRSRDTVLMRR